MFNGKPRTIAPDHFDKLRANIHILYRCFDVAKSLLYVGMTSNPEERIKQHRADKPWWGDVDHMTIQKFRNRRALAIAEAVAIHPENPKYNIASGFGTTSPWQGGSPSKTGRRLWPQASTFCTITPDYGFLIDMTLEQQLYPCIECHAQAIYNDGDTVACGMCSVEWTYDSRFDMTFNSKPNTPHQMRLL
jgi:hypothetical protein